MRMGRSAGALGGNPAFSPFLAGPVLPPMPSEAGWKDTINVFPGFVNRFVIRWAPQATLVGAVQPGQNLFSFDPTKGPGYVLHCHIIDHEDNEMMRPYLPVP
jgi:FtsP/CotA-like multicopper oxidase with cupredoxin domain